MRSLGLPFVVVAVVASACSVITNLDDLSSDAGVDAALDGTALDGSTIDAHGDASTDADANTGPVVDGAYAFSTTWDTSSTSGQGAASIASLAGGGYVIGGDYSGANVVFGPYPVPTANGTRDGYVATLDANGNATAVIGFGGAGADEVTAVAADPSGAIYIAGLVPSGATLNGVALSAGTFIAKLDSKNLTAPPTWTRSFEISVPCARCLTVVGTTLTVGTVFFGTVHYDTQGMVTSNGGYDMLFLEMDTAAGNVGWASQIGGTANDVVVALARDASNALYLVGDFASPSLPTNGALGAKTPTPIGTGANLLVAKLDAAHNPVYANAYGDPAGSGVSAGGIAPDNAGHVAVGATFFGGVDFGMGVTGASAANGIVFVIDEKQSKTIWQQPIAPNANFLEALAVDPWGHVIVAGTYTKTVKIGSTNLTPTPAGSEGTYVAKFGPPTYGVDWAAAFPQLGDAGASVTASSVTVAPNGTVVVSGAFAGTADFGSGPVTAISSTYADSFVAGRVP